MSDRYDDRRNDRPRFARYGTVALLVGLLAAGLSALGYLLSPDAFFPAYLIAFLFWLGISLGSLAIAMLHHLSGGGWGVPIRRVLEAAYGVLPLMAVLFVPLLFGLSELYLWARPSEVAHDDILLGKARYLNAEWFPFRAAAYFAVWMLFGFILNRLSASADPATARLRERRLALVSGPGLICWALAVTFASIDWVMSLEPHWYSSMYGVLFMAGQGVSALAAAILCVITLRRASPWNEQAATSRLHDLGNLLLAFVLFWSYVSFMQFLIIWSGNLPEDTPYYIHRTGSWQAVAVALAALHFAVPFLLLLVRQNKRRTRRLAAIAALLLAMRLVDLYWLVMPTFSPGRLTFHWLHLVLPVAIGGLWLAMFSWRLAARSALPVLDPLPSEEEEAHRDAAQPAH